MIMQTSKSIVFRDDRGSVVFCGLKDEFRTSASFARTVRIDVPLRGRWCSLITAREALSVCATDCGQSGAARDNPATVDDAVDEDVRIVTLH